MAIQLTKGQRIDIGLQQLSVGLGWDPNTNASSADYDLDASAFMLGADGQVPMESFFVFYGNPESPDQAVKSSGDDRTGGNSEGDDEILSVDLTRLDPRIEQIVFTVTIYDFDARKQNFGQVRNSFIRVCDSSSGQELCKYELDEDFSIETAIEFGRLYKRGGAWRFEAMGVGTSGGLQAFVNKFAKRFSA
ncbi:MAG: TerD family protein [Verrucomicrobiota bacterium]